MLFLRLDIDAQLFTGRTDYKVLEVVTVFNYQNKKTNIYQIS